MPKPKWKKTTLKLKDDHQWTGTPGYKVFVADRGAVRFEFPETWIVTPGEDAIKFYNRRPPDDDCLLQLSVMRLPPGIDWSGLPLRVLLKEATRDDHRGAVPLGEIVDVRRPDLELAWTEARFTDPVEQREALSRTCLARGSNIQPLITLDYWPEDAGRFVPVWDHVLETLRLGEYIADPTRGAPPRRWG